jgi:diguanylate cyclase (GGDEF)-like protein/PAS domain S-box-containing protein
MRENGRMRILSMEDDAGLSRLLQKNLERNGYAVDVAADGEAGLALLEGNAYDLMLLDYHMPVCSGVEVIRRLTARGALPPTVMLTGEGNVEAAVEALKLGASDYIVKDVEMKYLDLLPVVIGQVLEKHRLVREREQMMEKVRESEERYRSLVELSPDGIILHAGERLLFANTTAARYLGAEKPGDLEGRSVIDFVHPDFHEVVRERIRRLESRADCVPWIEEKLVRLDGRVMDVEVAAAPSLYQGKPAVQEIFRDIKERKLAARRLEHMALYDALTDLPNRSLFFDRLNHTFAVARRNRYLFAVLFIDLDGFKRVNDCWGHDVGDLLLREAAKRISGTVRASDTVARMGGDEFTVILTKVQFPADPGIVAEKIITALSRPFTLQGIECAVSASIGISWYPGDGDCVEALLKKADTAMYRVKENGRGGYRFYAEPAGGGCVS